MTSARATADLGSDAHNWLLRCYRQDRLAMAFCSAVLADLPRPVQSISLEDDTDLINYWVPTQTH
jgi:hypothetical protein